MEADYSTHEIRIKRLVRIFSVDTERWGDDDHDKFLTPGQQLRPLRSLVLFAQGWGCGQCRETTSNCWFLWRKLLCLTMILFLPLVSLLEMCMRIEDLWIFAWTSKTCCDFDSFEINRFGQPVNLVWTPLTHLTLEFTRNQPKNPDVGKQGTLVDLQASKDLTFHWGTNGLQDVVKMLAFYGNLQFVV